MVLVQGVPVSDRVHDYSIQELEDQLFSAILLTQRQYNCIKMPIQERQAQALELSQKLLQTRGNQQKLTALYSGNGHGPFAEMVDGSVKFDLIGGIGPYLLGHSHPLQIRASLAASRCSLLNSTNFLPLARSVDTAEQLIKMAAPSKLAHCWFSSSGSMANDSALRLLWQKRSPRKRLIVFENSFAGRTVSMQAITAPTHEQQSFAIDTIFFPTDQSTAEQSLQQLKKIIAAYPDQHAAFHGELLQGEGGVHLPYQTGIKELFEILKTHNIPIWIDEVQTFARTNQLFAFQFLGLSEFVDICTIGKAFNLAAVLYTKDFALAEGLGGTFQGPVAALEYAHGLLNLLEKGNILGAHGRVEYLSEQIRQMFNHVEKQLNTTDNFVKADGLGTIWRLQVGDLSLNIIEQTLSELFKNGIIAWKAGRKTYCLRFLFPLTLTPQHLEQIGNILIHSLTKVQNNITES